MKKNNQQIKNIIKIFFTLVLILMGTYFVYFQFKNNESEEIKSFEKMEIKNDISGVNNDSPIIKTEKTEELPDKTIDTQNIVNFKLIIDNQKQEISAPKDSTLYDVFKILKSNNKLIFEGQNYSGLGFFVTKIGSLSNGEGGNLMYYINGVEASEGVSSYIVKEGDIIEWKIK